MRVLFVAELTYRDTERQARRIGYAAERIRRQADLCDIFLTISCSMFLYVFVCFYMFLCVSISFYVHHC